MPRAKAFLLATALLLPALTAGSSARALDPTCPPPDGPAPSEPAPPMIDFDNEPRPGHYQFAFRTELPGEEPEETVGLKRIGRTELEGNGYFYSVQDLVVGIKVWMQIVPFGDLEPSPGLYLRRIDIPAGPELGSAALPFIPVTPLRLAAFPFQPTSAQTSVALDIAPKALRELDLPYTDGFLPEPTANVMRSTMTMGVREIVEVCDELAQAWKTDWDLRISGDYDVSMTGVFWIASQFGGWPIKESYVLGGDLLRGAFGSNLMRLDRVTPSA